MPKPTTTSDPNQRRLALDPSPTRPPGTLPIPNVNKHDIYTVLCNARTHLTKPQWAHHAVIEALVYVLTTDQAAISRRAMFILYRVSGVIHLGGVQPKHNNGHAPTSPLEAVEAGISYMRQFIDIDPTVSNPTTTPEE